MCGRVFVLVFALVFGLVCWRGEGLGLCMLVREDESKLLLSPPAAALALILALISAAAAALVLALALAPAVVVSARKGLPPRAPRPHTCPVAGSRHTTSRE